MSKILIKTLLKFLFIFIRVHKVVFVVFLSFVFDLFCGGFVLRGVVLHGGAGTRLRPLTYSGPKQLIPVANKPVSQYVVENLRDCGVKGIARILLG
jgi:hypothetical protein